jgi:thiamine-phosphate pyrophosphorylase
MRGLYAIVDPAVCIREPGYVAERILAGGCAALQLRDKLSTDREVVALGRELAQLCGRADVPLIINDRFWLAQEIGASGVHVGQTDTPLPEVRRQLPPQLTVGVSSHDLAQALAAEHQGADLVGFGPVFPTGSKADADPVVGVLALRELCQHVRIPVVAIGGINLERAAAVSACGAPLGAAISALCAAQEIEQAAAALHAALGGTRRSTG